MTIKRKKIALIGAGNIGGTLAHLVELKQLGDVVLFDVADGLAKGKSLDLMQSSTINGHDIEIKGTNDYNEIKNSDVVIVTAGIARKPGMSRDDLLKTNCEIIKSVGEALRNHAPEAFVIVITNPLDAMVTLMQKVTKFDPKKVVGMAGVLDTARFKHFLAEAMNISVDNISSFVLGGHGDTMVPVIEHTSVSGIKLQEFIDKGFVSKEKIQEIIQRTKDGGAEIVGLLKTGSAFYAPAVSAIEMAEAYLRDKRKILPCAAYLNGEYGVKGFYIGVPAIIGAGGVEKVIEVSMTEEVRVQFKKSVESVQNLVKDLPI